MVVCGHLLLVHRLHLFYMVAAAVPFQRDAGVVSAVRDGENHRANAGPTWLEAAQGRVEGQASCRFRAGNGHRWP